MKWFCFLFMLVVACSPYRGLRQSSFTVNGDKGLEILLPKGYLKKERSVDVAGNVADVYKYSGGRTIFFVQVKDTASSYLPIDKEVHQHLITIDGGKYFKWQDADGRFHREVQNKEFRYGYTGIKYSDETKFDSVINFVRIK